MEISHVFRQLNAVKIGGNKADMANIVISMFSGAADLSEAETMMFYKLSKHILEHMSSGSD